MATNPYEVEHNIKASEQRKNRRRPDMSSFSAHLHHMSSDPAHSRIGATPADSVALFQLVQDQMSTLAADAPTEANREFLLRLGNMLEEDIRNGADRIQGVDQTYLDSLDRVSRKKLQSDPEGACMICAEKFVDDPHPLVVELPCHSTHIFDLECVGPWLLSKGTCPACRHDLTKKKTVEIPKDEEEDEDVDGLYG
ncbi:hypothetical protein F5B22DRAFT_91168 [Xylaria bambusicola]|uniref:uncharacterized protein n=1 Tax=Xylaria bambusicola TaxID=326684 RepID=UPI002008DE2D|nr:uncharacterized protein F5B22DRAFT_91168 [Xylaria bambusicola]KAI0518084.1 hypothetical protein F5B22DRAFT_91168 [Xylaria bambusicola]